MELGGRTNEPAAQSFAPFPCWLAGGYPAVTGVLRENALASSDGMLTLNR